MQSNWKIRYYRYTNLFLNIVQVYQRRTDVKEFLEILLSLATISIFSIFALKPTMVTITELVKEIRKKEGVVKQLDSKISTLATAQRVFSEQQANINLLDLALPKTLSPETFSRQMEGIANVDGISFKGMTVGKAVLAGTDTSKLSKEESRAIPQGASAAVFSANYSGSFESISSFLKHLESMRRPPILVSSAISKSSSKDASPDTLNFVLSGYLPYVKQD